MYLLPHKIKLALISIINLIDLIRNSDWKKIDCLFICSIADRSLKINEYSYSRILDPIGYQLVKKNRKIKHISWNYDDRKNYFNYKYIGLVTRSKFFSLFFFKYICRTKVVVAIGWSEGLLSAAKLLNIMTVEPLHGFGIDEDDYIWGINNKFNFTPNIFLTYDDQSCRTLNANRFKNFLVKRCQHPCIENDIFCENYHLSFRNSIDHYKQEYNRLGLITLQHGYEGSRDFLKNILPNGLIHESLVSFMLEKKEVFWIVRAHPMQLTRNDWPQTLANLKELFKLHSNVNVVKFHDIDITEIIVRADIHITMMSGTIEECALFHVPSIALCPTLLDGSRLQKAFLFARQNKLFYHSELNETAIKREFSKALLKQKATKSKDDVLKESLIFESSFDVINQLISTCSVVNEGALFNN